MRLFVLWIVILSYVAGYWGDLFDCTIVYMEAMIKVCFCICKDWKIWMYVAYGRAAVGNRYIYILFLILHVVDLYIFICSYCFVYIVTWTSNCSSRDVGFGYFLGLLVCRFLCIRILCICWIYPLWFIHLWNTEWFIPFYEVGYTKVFVVGSQLIFLAVVSSTLLEMEGAEILKSICRLI